jgi:uncharacterized membrane protein
LISGFDYDEREEDFVNTKSIIHVGIALILLGIVAFTYHGRRDNSRDWTSDFGPVQAGVNTTKTVSIAPVLAGLVLVGGIVLVVVGVKKSS